MGSSNLYRIVARRSVNTHVASIAAKKRMHYAGQLGEAFAKYANSYELSYHLLFIDSSR